MVRENIYIEEVQYGDGMAEALSITVKTSGRIRRRIVVSYVPPKTNSWRLEEHKEMQREVLKFLEDILTNDKKILLLGDFNCKNINWEEMEVYENAGQWGEDVLQMAMVYTMDQWVNEFTRYRGGEEPSMLDLVFTKKPETCPFIKYLSPMGKSDHVTLEIELQNWKVLEHMEEHKQRRLNHAKSNFDGLSKFFGSIDWK